MEKELGELFKKSGRIPEMNVKIMELRELEIELKEEQEKMGEYAPSIERIREIDERCLQSCENRKKNLCKNHRSSLLCDSCSLFIKKNKHWMQGCRN